MGYPDQPPMLAKQPPPTESSTLDGHLDLLQRNAGQLSDAVYALREKLDALIGPEPEDQTEPGPSSDVLPLLGQLNLADIYTRDLLQQLNAEVQRVLRL